jgi:hypothetical protein
MRTNISFEFLKVENQFLETILQIPLSIFFKKNQFLEAKGKTSFYKNSINTNSALESGKTQ